MQSINRIRNFIYRFESLFESLCALNEQLPEIFSRLSGLESRLSGLETRIDQGIFDNRKLHLSARYHLVNQVNHIYTQAELNELVSLEDQLYLLERMIPKAYNLWKELFDNSIAAYSGCPTHSCSVLGHSVGTLFRFFVKPYLKGRVLDVGCGPQPVPLYLHDCPVGCIHGIDPVSDPQHHPFYFVKGLAEFLPWKDRQFETCIAATSLDHVFLLDKALREIHRVLCDDGVFLAWVAFVPNSKPYNPYERNVQKVDEFHLFHFDRGWFLDIIGDFFAVLEEIRIDNESYFYALNKK